MAGLTMSQLAELPLSSPILLNIYTSFIVIVTAALTIWGPKVLSAVVERAQQVTSSSSEESKEAEDEKKEKDDEEKKDEDKDKDKDKKWKRKNQIWTYGWEDVDRPKPSEEDDDSNITTVHSRFSSGYRAGKALKSEGKR